LKAINITSTLSFIIDDAEADNDGITHNELHRYLCIERNIHPKT